MLSDHPWELMAARRLQLRAVGIGYARLSLSSLCALQLDAIAATSAAPVRCWPITGKFPVTAAAAAPRPSNGAMPLMLRVYVNVPTGRPDPAQAPGARQVNSQQLLGATKELLIEHNGQLYRLRETRARKLILTKQRRAARLA